MTGPGRYLLAVTLCYLAWVTTGDEMIKQVKEEEATTESSADKVTYQGSQVISICQMNSTKFTEFTKSLLEDKDLEYWGRNETCSQYYVPSDKVEAVKAKLSESGLPFSTMIEDLQRAIDTENPPVEEESEEQVGKVGHKMSWTSYHRLNDINGYLDYLSQTYPQLVTVGTLGSSVEGRPIKYAKVSSGQPNAKSFWIDGGIHAREWISPASVSYILYELVENREAHLKQVEGIDYYILPVMNPDGYEYTHMRDRLWRKNRSKGGFYCQGTDLNRNWAYKWGGKGSSKQQCQEIYGGRTAFSEPETRAVSNFILSSVSNAKGFLTFHSYGQYILYPYGYDTDQLPEDHQDLDRVARKMAQAMRQAGGSQYIVGNSANSLYPASGGADDWAKGVANIKYTYTIELRDKGRYGFVLPSQFIQPTAKEALAAVKVMSAEIQALP